MGINQILEIIERYKLRIPPTVYYDLLADVVEVEEEQEPTTKNDLGVDCISRKEVDRIINKWLSHPDYELKDHIYSMTEKIHNLPSVTPQEPRKMVGSWIKSQDSYGNNHFTCPFCEHDIATKYDGTWEDNYCSNCGADMRGEE